jgi:hypothetical protein
MNNDFRDRQVCQIVDSERAVGRFIAWELEKTRDVHDNNIVPACGEIADHESGALGETSR